MFCFFRRRTKGVKLLNWIDLLRYKTMSSLETMQSSRRLAIKSINHEAIVLKLEYNLQCSRITTIKSLQYLAILHILA